MLKINDEYLYFYLLMETRLRQIMKGEIAKSQKFTYIKSPIGDYIIGLEKSTKTLAPVCTVSKNVANPEGVALGIVKILNQQKNYILPI